MKLHTFSAAQLAVSALLFTPTAQADDLKALEGTWKVESVEVGGKKVESDDLKDIEVKITGERYTVRVKDKMDAGTLKLDETQNPKTMDGTDTEGDDVGKVTKTIYELSGDTLRVCYPTEGTERPKALSAKEGEPVLLVTYQRVKKPA